MFENIGTLLLKLRKLTSCIIRKFNGKQYIFGKVLFNYVNDCDGDPHTIRYDGQNITCIFLIYYINLYWLESLQ
jgi:hypothetical protein